MNEQPEQPQFDITKIKLIIGLGNLGREYIGTRHNVGFEFVETLAGTSRFNEEKKLKALIHVVEDAHGNSLPQGQKIILAKPTTMMNSSGEAVQLIKNFYKLEDEEILVVHDDLDLLIGSYKIQFSKGPKVHNGIISIENRLGSTKFWRLRIGVENRDAITRKNFPGMAYVLGKFKSDEVAILQKMFDDIIKNFLG